MPCYMTGSAGGDARLAAHEARAEATMLSRMLCAIVGITPGDMLAGWEDSVEGFREWLARHRKVDRRRAERERQKAEHDAARRAALQKLTPEERAALGVK